jgi:hypothetical protein
MVVRFVCVVCVPLCVRVFRVSRVCPGSPGVFFPGPVRNPTCFETKKPKKEFRHGDDVVFRRTSRNQALRRLRAVREQSVLLK